MVLIALSAMISFHKVSITYLPAEFIIKLVFYVNFKDMRSISRAAIFLTGHGATNTFTNFLQTTILIYPQ